MRIYNTQTGAKISREGKAQINIKGSHSVEFELTRITAKQYSICLFLIIYCMTFSVDFYK